MNKIEIIQYCIQMRRKYTRHLWQLRTSLLRNLNRIFLPSLYFVFTVHFTQNCKFSNYSNNTVILPPLRRSISLNNEYPHSMHDNAELQYWTEISLSQYLISPIQNGNINICVVLTTVNKIRVYLASLSQFNVSVSYTNILSQEANSSSLCLIIIIFLSWLILLIPLHLDV